MGTLKPANPGNIYAPLCRYSPGTYFGELALLYNGTRRANVVAAGPCTTASLNKASFDRLLGPLNDILEAGMSRYQQHQHPTPLLQPTAHLDDTS